jgi:hypothetical protein
LFLVKEDCGLLVAGLGVAMLLMRNPWVSRRVAAAILSLLSNVKFPAWRHTGDQYNAYLIIVVLFAAVGGYLVMQKPGIKG